MKIVAEYRERAAECEQLAARVITPDQREAIMQIARAWRELADSREAMLKQGGLAEGKE